MKMRIGKKTVRVVGGGGASERASDTKKKGREELLGAKG